MPDTVYEFAFAVQILYICTEIDIAMETKLTLRLNDNVIERAKLYARSHEISLSKMIESYLDSLTKEKKDENKASITPLIASLSGVINLPEEYDYKTEYRGYVMEKYK